MEWMPIGYLPSLLAPWEKYAHFRSRDECEENPEFRQIIPYTYLQNADGRVAMYSRRSAHTEGRLANLASIGIGGHIDISDMRETLQETVEHAQMRELLEETGIPGFYRGQVMGVLTLSGSMVNKVHVGVVFRLVTSILPSSTEEIEAFKWFDSTTYQREQKWEDWSHVLLQNLPES